jgi:hypothetical protein
MKLDLIKEIRSELGRLNSESYRKEQAVFITEKQLVYLNKILSKASKLEKAAISDFLRCVNDVASSNAKITVLSEQLYEKAKKD